MKNLKKNKRLLFVDLLRGMAIFTMILTHTNAYFLSDKIAYYIWDISGFSVTVFIFCSAYIFFYQKISFQNIKQWFDYIKNRFIRLLKPYYLFSFVFFLVLFLKEPKTLTKKYLFQSLTITGGIDINWLVLLFIYFAVLLPLIKLLIDKKPFYFYLYCFFAFLASVIFLFRFSLFASYYKLFMWLPWSLVIIISYYLFRYKKSSFFSVIVFLFSLLIYVFLFWVKSRLHHPLSMYSNKYPPNLFHLSYGISSLFVLIWLSKTKLLKTNPVSSFFVFLSKNSYSLFFIHYLFIFIITLFFNIKFNWFGFFITVLSASIITQVLLNFFYLFSTLKREPTI